MIFGKRFSLSDFISMEFAVKLRISSQMKHALHVICFMTLLLWFEHDPISYLIWPEPIGDGINPEAKYGHLGYMTLHFLRLVNLLSLPSCIFGTLGLVFLNAFKSNVILQQSIRSAPFICLRVVTRGNYRELVKNTVTSNIRTCLNVGMDNFIVEVVTGKELNLPKNDFFREIVVPENYETKFGTMFKARKLQYCLEDDVNQLSDDDWIVHLDEETLLTENSMKGILNFCIDGRHLLGQGVITYGRGNIVNWITTFADSYRVAENYGLRRFIFQYLHRPLTGWHGSFMVMRMSAERRITFDHGPAGSIAEDYCFSGLAYAHGYTFDYIEGEVYEQSTFTIGDFLLQRKRWFHGIFLVLYSIEIPYSIKAILLISYLEWTTSPLTTLNMFVSLFLPLPCNSLIEILLAFVRAVTLYNHVFGIFKMFSHRYEDQPWKLIFFMFISLFSIPISICLGNVAVLYAIFCGIFQSHVYQFHIVKK